VNASAHRTGGLAGAAANEIGSKKLRSIMMVTINGERHEIPDSLNITALLAHLGMPTDRVAIERNFDILPRACWPETAVQPNDHFEIVHFVGGG
jgi:thiamine biosynthesis protein ThiS